MFCVIGTVKPSRRHVFIRAVFIGIGAVTLVGCVRGEQSGETRKPNIIYVLADDLGYGDLGCYGQREIRTPNLDRMAQQGMRFTRHYAGSTVCAPSRCSLMTGLHTGHAYIRGNALISLRPEDKTAAEIMKEAGYTTALIGKWGLGEAGTPGIPNRKGFDYFFGYLNQLHAHNYYPAYLWRNEDRVELGNVVRDVNPPGGVATRRVEYSHDLFTTEACEFIEAHQDVPFFLYLAYTIPHANNENRPDGMEVPSYGDYAQKNWPNPQKGHAAMISRLDRDMGRLVTLLKKLGLDRDTIVFFSSDNGPHKEGGADPAFFKSSGPLRGYKRDLTEGGIRVPLIAWAPGKIQAGVTSDHVSAFWDMMPTWADFAGVDMTCPTDGLSLVPVLTGRAETVDHDYLYWEFHERGFRQAVCMGRWKGIRHGVEGKIELFDLSNDPGEEHDVAGENPGMVRDIEARMLQARSHSDHWKPQD